MFSGLTAMGQQMTHAEQVVRTTYAKLSYADEVRTIINTMNAAPDRFQADERSADKALNSRLEFQLSNFKTGPISEIEGRIASELSGEPTEGDTDGILKATPGTFNYQDNSATGKANSGPTEWALYVDARWETKPYRRFPASGWPMAALMGLPEMDGPYDRYASYTVTITFQSKSRTYNTAAFFGKNADGSERVHFIDSVTEMMTLDLLAKTDMSTAPFRKTHLRNVSFVRKWLNSNQQSCSVKGHGDVCCNPETRRCGISTSAPISRSLP
jgi:hypothetical protein